MCCYNDKESFTGLLDQALASGGGDGIQFQGHAETAIVSDLLDITCLGCNVTELRCNASRK